MESDGGKRHRVHTPSSPLHCTATATSLLSLLPVAGCFTVGITWAAILLFSSIALPRARPPLFAHTHIHTHTHTRTHVHTCAQAVLRRTACGQ